MYYTPKKLLDPEAEEPVIDLLSNPPYSAEHRLHWTKGIRPLPKLNLHFGLYLVSGIIPARPSPVKPTVSPLWAKEKNE